MLPRAHLHKCAGRRRSYVCHKRKRSSSGGVWTLLGLLVSVRVRVAVAAGVGSSGHPPPPPASRSRLARRPLAAGRAPDDIHVVGDATPACLFSRGLSLVPQSAAGVGQITRPASNGTARNRTLQRRAGPRKYPLVPARRRRRRAARASPSPPMFRPRQQQPPRGAYWCRHGFRSCGAPADAAAPRGGPRRTAGVFRVDNVKVGVVGWFAYCSTRGLLAPAPALHN